MIPEFPNFKKLELADKAQMEAHTEKFAPYSDFEFGSLWAWDVREEMELSLLNDNIVIRFTDYVTGEPFFTFIGTNEVDETATALIALAHMRGYRESLDLVPEVTAELLSAGLFDIQESRDHFDYLYELEQHIGYGGGKLKSRRNFLNGFLKKYPHYGAVPLDLSEPHVREHVLKLCKRWEQNKGQDIPNEAMALGRFLASIDSFRYASTGLTAEGELVGFCTSILLPGSHANALFEKVDINYHGVHAAMRSEVARDLRRRGYTHLNYEQDLGIVSLRQSKMAFNPSGFLKKYCVTARSASPNE